MPVKTTQWFMAGLRELRLQKAGLPQDSQNKSTAAELNLPSSAAPYPFLRLCKS